MTAKKSVQTFSLISITAFVLVLALQVVIDDSRRGQAGEEKNRHTSQRFTQVAAAIPTVDDFLSRPLPKQLHSRMVVASLYDLPGRTMANGDEYDPDAMTVAHKTLPFGTRVLFQNLCDRREIVAVVTDRGPFIKGREFDFSVATANKVGTTKEGVAMVMATVLKDV